MRQTDYFKYNIFFYLSNMYIYIYIVFFLYAYRFRQYSRTRADPSRTSCWRRSALPEAWCDGPKPVRMTGSNGQLA